MESIKSRLQPSMLAIETCISELGQELHWTPQMTSTCQEKLLPLIQQHVSQQVEKQELEHTQLREEMEQLGEQSRKDARNNEHIQQQMEQMKQQVEQMKQQVEQMKQQNAKTEQKFDKTEQKFDKIEQQFDKNEQKFDKNEQKFDKNDQKFDNLEQQLYAVQERDLVAKAWCSVLVVDRYYNIEQLSPTVQNNQTINAQAKGSLIQYGHSFAHGGGSLRHQIEWIVDQVDNEGYRDHLAQNVDPIWASRTTDQIVEAWTLCSPTMLAQLECKSIAMLLNCSLVI